MTLNEFVLRANETHRHRFDYSKSVYTNTSTKVEILCFIHGSFFQTPADHLYRGHACPGCKFDKNANTRRERARNTFVDKAIKVHGTKYDYSLVNYKKATSYVNIICPEHGMFKRTPNVFLNGTGCRACGYERLSTLKTKPLSLLVQQFVKVHGTKYDYSKVIYTGDKNKIEIICPEHGILTQTPNSHLRGNGCLKCSSRISKNELRIIHWLEQNCILFIKDKTFVDLHGKTKTSRLRYDFWLPEQQILIEYDGEHHFCPVRRVGRNSITEATKLYERFVINDKKKTEYAQQNRYHLIRIPYTQRDHLEEILTREVLGQQPPSKVE